MDDYKELIKRIEVLEANDIKTQKLLADFVSFSDNLAPQIDSITGEIQKLNNSQDIDETLNIDETLDLIRTTKEKFTSLLTELESGDSDEFDYENGLFKTGDIVEVISDVGGHIFDTGEKITLIGFDYEDELWSAENSEGIQWYIKDDAFK